MQVLAIGRHVVEIGWLRNRGGERAGGERSRAARKKTPSGSREAELHLVLPCWRLGRPERGPPNQTSPPWEFLRPHSSQFTVHGGPLGQTHNRRSRGNHSRQAQSTVRPHQRYFGGYMYM